MDILPVVAEAVTPMTNPIDQRRANPRATGCPVFWRQFGNGLAFFLALLPWVALALSAVTSALAAGMIHFSRARNFPVASLFTTATRITNNLSMFTLVLWVFLLVPTLVFWWMMERAARRGAAEKKRCHLCLLGWLVGFFALLTIPRLFF